MAQSKEVLRKKIELLRDERLKRSHKDQINVLDSRLGKNVGAVKERTRLLEKINSTVKNSNIVLNPTKKSSEIKPSMPKKDMDKKTAMKIKKNVAYDEVVLVSDFVNLDNSKNLS